MSFEDIRLKQSTLAALAGVSFSAVYRRVTEAKIKEVSDNTNMHKKYDLEAIQEILSFFVRKDIKTIDKKVHVFYNFKGGTGKTSLAYQVSSHLALMGFKVLAIDLDPQAHLTSMLGFAEEHNCETIYSVFGGMLDIKNVIVKIASGLHAIPSSLELSKLEMLLASKTCKEAILDDVIETIRDDYDFIIIDANPAISSVNINALNASDQINIVCETHPFSLSGLSLLLEELGVVSSALKKQFSYCIIPNKYESKTATAQEVLGALRADYKENLTKTVVRKCEDFNLATKYRMPLCGFSKKKSPALEDIIDLVRELLKFSINQGELVVNEEFRDVA